MSCNRCGCSSPNRCNHCSPKCRRRCSPKRCSPVRCCPRKRRSPRRCSPDRCSPQRFCIVGRDFIWSYKNTSQASTSAFQDILFDVNGPTNGWVHIPGTAPFIAPVNGTYEVAYSVNLQATTNQGGSVRVAVNGSEVVGSAITQTIIGPTPGFLEFENSIIVTLAQNQSLTIQFAGNVFVNNPLPILNETPISASLVITRIA